MYANKDIIIVSFRSNYLKIKPKIDQKDHHHHQQQQQQQQQQPQQQQQHTDIIIF